MSTPSATEASSTPFTVLLSLLRDAAKTVVLLIIEISLLCLAFPFRWAIALPVFGVVILTLFVFYWLARRRRLEASLEADEVKQKILRRRAFGHELAGVLTAFVALVAGAFLWLVVYPGQYIVTGLSIAPWESSVFDTRAAGGGTVRVLVYRDWLRRWLAPRVFPKAHLIEHHVVNGHEYLHLPVGAIHEVVEDATSTGGARRSVQLEFPSRGCFADVGGVGGRIDFGADSKIPSIISDITPVQPDITPWRAVRLPSPEQLHEVAAYIAGLDTALRSLKSFDTERGIEYLAVLAAVRADTHSKLQEPAVPSSVEKARVELMLAAAARGMWKGNLADCVSAPIYNRAWDAVFLHLETQGSSCDQDLCRWVLRSLKRNLRAIPHADAADRLERLSATYAWTDYSTSTVRRSSPIDQIEPNILLRRGDVSSQAPEVKERQGWSWFDGKDEAWDACSLEELVRLAPSSLSRYEKDYLPDYVTNRIFGSIIQNRFRTDSHLSTLEREAVKAAVRMANLPEYAAEVERRCSFLQQMAFATSLFASQPPDDQIVRGLAQLAEQMGFPILTDFFSRMAEMDAVQIHERFAVLKPTMHRITQADLMAPWWSVRAQDAFVSFIALSAFCTDIKELPAAAANEEEMEAAIRHIMNGSVPGFLQREPELHQADLPLKVAAAVFARTHARLHESHVRGIDPGQAFEPFIADRLGLAEGASLVDASATITALFMFSQPGKEYVVPLIYPLKPEEFVVESETAGVPVDPSLVELLHRITHAGLSLREVAQETTKTLSDDVAETKLEEAVMSYVSDAERILRNLGYLNASVEPLELPQDNPLLKFRLRVTLNERFVVGYTEIKVVGDVPELMRDARSFPVPRWGTAYTPERVEEIRLKLQEQLQRQGYPDLKVVIKDSSDEETEEGRTDTAKQRPEQVVRKHLHFKVVPGSRCRVSSVFVTCAEGVPSDAYRSILGVVPGEWWPGPPTKEVKDAILRLHMAYGYGFDRHGYQLVNGKDSDLSELREPQLHEMRATPPRKKPPAGTIPAATDTSERRHELRNVGQNDASFREYFFQVTEP